MSNRLEILKKRERALRDTMASCIDVDDLHGVSDAANDLRVVLALIDERQRTDTEIVEVERKDSFEPRQLRHRTITLAEAKCGLTASEMLALRGGVTVDAKPVRKKPRRK